LSISKKIIEGFNSQLEFRTELGKGSTFYFDLSLNLADTQTNNNIYDVVIKNITSLQNKNILIVEDSMVNVIILKQFLKKWGCTFTSVENGLEGLKAVKEQIFDVVLMDLQMPIMDGITCTKEIRALTDIYYKTVPIIVLTAANENTMRDAAYAVGMNDYILKPFEPKNLQEKMIKAINESLA
jgi:CheY-like chemotaxis protein